MFKIKYFLSLVVFLVGTSIYAQSLAIRKQLQQKFTTTEAVQAIKEIEQKNEDAQQILQRYSKQNRLFKEQFVDEMNYYQAQRIERNTVIYFKTLNTVSRTLSGIDQMLASTDNSINQLEGQSMIVGIIDGDLVFDKHIEFAKPAQSRVHLLEIWDENIEEEAAGFSAVERRRTHATHVAGTIIAQGKNPKSKGMAPEAEAYSYKWDKDSSKMGYLAQKGILVTNHSYGIAAVDDQKRPLLPVDYFGAYTTDAVNMDKIAYVYPYLQPVVAAGNDKVYTEIVNPEKGGMDLLLGHATAKNAIVVGAIGLDHTGRVQETDFSSNGPTNDFRIKPDIVANGLEVYSSAYQYLFSTGEIEKNNLYAVLSGTSMAAPSVSGILLLWQQWALEHKNFPYKAATLKGIMINTAQELGGQKGPNAKTGWGLIDAWHGVQLLTAASKNQAVVNEETLIDNNVNTKQIRIDEKVDRLSFTICWSDVEGKYEEANFKEFNGVKNLVNDLDLRVYKDGVVYFPWKLTESFTHSEAVRGDNIVDNVERIDIDSPELGTYEIVISHKGKLVNKIQDYSLLVNSNTYKGVVLENTEIGEQNKQLIAWPNPADEIVNVEIPNDFIFSALKATIYDSTGKQITTIPMIAANRQSLKVSFLASGIYFLRIEGAAKKYQVKFIKK